MSTPRVHSAKLQFKGVCYDVRIEQNPDGVEDVCSVTTNGFPQKYLALGASHEASVALNSKQARTLMYGNKLKAPTQRVHPVSGDARVRRAADFEDMLWQFIKAVDDGVIIAEDAKPRRELANGFVLRSV